MKAKRATKAVNVRSAKAHLSELLELAASGEEIIVTSGGQPKARLMPPSDPKNQKPFGGAKAHLRQMKQRRGASAEEIIRDERDSRG